MADIPSYTYDKVFRLFCAARRHYRQAQAIEDQIGIVLGMKPPFWESHLADLMFADKLNEKKIKRALARDGFEVKS